MLEREVKIWFANPDHARAALSATGATPYRPRRLQDDTLYDTPDSALRERRTVLRVRREPDQAYLTFKGPVTPGTMKLREEHETAVADDGVVRRVLAELGLEAWFRYQKYREEFRTGDVVIAIDETPVGTYMEIEGSEDGILVVTAALGRSPADFILESYRGLFLTFARTHGLTTRDMLFESHRPTT